MPLAALAEPATQTSAATSVERITLLILGVVSGKRGEGGGVEQTKRKAVENYSSSNGYASRVTEHLS